MIELFAGGFLQAVVLAFNIRNIAERNILWSMFTSFLLSFIWAYVVREIARDLDGMANVFWYAAGVSTGTFVGGYASLVNFNIQARINDKFKHRQNINPRNKGD